MLKVSDEAIKPLVELKMQGNIALDEGETEESVINDYFNHPNHINYAIDKQITGFLCTSEYEDYVVINFAWGEGSFKALKKLVALAKDLHKHYTVTLNLPIYYSGFTNLYTNHSKDVGKDVWEFVI